MPDMWDRFGFALLNTVSFVLVGLAFFGLAFAVLVKVIKVPLRKEIEEDQNVALAIIIGAFILGISIIIAAAVHG
ncbi:MAG: DUF350 domain-containing protein [Gemmataceae bacterium]|nr:DUF350 domain-containing protein [Gemmataceae bacterium]